MLFCSSCYSSRSVWWWKAPSVVAMLTMHTVDPNVLEMCITAKRAKQTKPEAKSCDAYAAAHLHYHPCPMSLLISVNHQAPKSEGAPRVSQGCRPYSWFTPKFWWAEETTLSLGYYSAFDKQDCCGPCEIESSLKIVIVQMVSWNFWATIWLGMGVLPFLIMLGGCMPEA